jgi:hypothetical protein
MQRGSGIYIAVVIVALGASADGAGSETQPAAESPSPAGDSTVALQDDATFREFMESLVRDALPVEYENHKQWKKTKEVFAGWRLSRGGSGPRLNTQRRTVRHGSWKAYRIRLIDPENNLHFAVRSPRPAADGGLRIDIEAIADLEVIGRFAEWRYDVQLFTINAQALATVKFGATCDIKLSLDPRHVPPDVVVQPVVRDAKVEVLEFELERVSELNGALAHELGQTLEPMLNDVLEEKRDRIVERLNRQLTKKQDKLRLSLHDAAKSMWREALVE